jgi:hypothetical protein
MRKAELLSLLVALLIVIIAAPTGCAPSITYDEAEVRAYTDPRTETTLQGLSEGDLAKYTEYGNSEFKAAVTQKMLDELKPNMDEELGDFVSIQFKSIDTKGNYIIVHYNAKYTKSEVGVRMVFDQDHLVAGQWFE